jgi:integrase
MSEKRKRLTDKQVEKLERRDQPYFYPDPELLKHGVRVRPTGPGTYTVVMRDAFKVQRWVKIGTTDEITVDEAREKARGVIKRLKAGEEAFPPPPVKADTVGDVVETYFKRHVEKKGFRTASEKKRIIDSHVLPVWRDRKFTAIGRSDIAKLCDAVEDRHGAWVADTVLVQLSAVARWYATRHDTYVPPFTVGMRRLSGDERKRSRVLTDDGIRRIWAAATDAGSYGAFIKVLLLTGQRREKVATMKWADLGRDGTWTIATDKREKNNPGSLVLPEAVLAIIHSLPRFAGNPYIFAATRGPGHIAHFAASKTALDQASDVSDYVVHDLRRSARSLLSRAHVRPDIAERVLGHVRKGVEGVYDRFPYADEKADALRRLAALIEQIINPPPAGKVVPLHKAAAAR